MTASMQNASTPSTPKPAKFARRRLRRLSARAAQTAAWWAALPDPRPDYFYPRALEHALNQPLRRVAAALRSLGWRRVVRRHYGVQITLWLPPQSRLRVRPRGRPRVWLP